MFTYREANDAVAKMNDEELWVRFCGVMLLLQDVGVEEISLSYSGSGDSGDYSEVTANPESAWRKAIEHPNIEMKSFHTSVLDGSNDRRSVWDTSAVWSVSYETQTVSLVSLVEDYLHRCVGLFFGGYENNEGGQGTATLDMKEWEIYVDHSDNELRDVLVEEVDIDMQNEATVEFIAGVKDCMIAWNHNADDPVTKVTACTSSETAGGGYYWGFRIFLASGRPRFLWGEPDSDKSISLAALCGAWMKKTGRDTLNFVGDDGQEVRITVDIESNHIEVSIWEQEEVEVERETRVFSVRENAPVSQDQEAP